MPTSKMSSSVQHAPKHAGVTESSEYIPAEYLVNLDKYKYSGSDSSILSRLVLQRYWEYVVSLVPMTVAPNLITFTGFIIGMSSTVILLYYYFFEQAVYPAWAWYYTAFSLFTYQTLDAIDGKQARRTGAGSPLGELFDHGCDAFLTPFVAVNTTLAANMPPWMTYVYMMTSTLGLFTAIWEQFSTGTFDLGYLSGPTEGILLVCLVFILAGYKTPAFFDTHLAGPYSYTIPANAVTRALGYGAVTVHLESARSFLLLFFLVPWVITVATNIAHAIVMPTVHKTRQVPFMAALATAAAVALNVVLFLVFPEAHAKFPFAFELSIGLLVSYTVTCLTISRLCVMPYSPLNFYYLYTVMIYIALLVLRAVPVHVVSAEMKDVYVGLAMLVLAFMGAYQYGRMVAVVFRQIAKYLGIQIMRITPKPKVN